jgi:hypothetical protein
MFTPERKLTETNNGRKLNVCLMLSGDERDRTANLLVANQALSQLSYVPREGESRPRDKACHQNDDLMIATAVGFG